MPKEQRRIIFSHEELFQAMAEFSKAGKSGPPLVGKFVSLEFMPQREPALTVTLQPPNSSMPQNIPYRKAEVAAAMIMWCRNKGIPLPKQSNRAFTKIDDQPVLLIEI